MKYTIIGFLACLCLWVACSDDAEGPTPFRTFQADRLLATDSVKTWQLIARSENGNPVLLDSCLSDNLLLFYQTIDTSGVDSNTFIFSSALFHCIDTVSNDSAYTISEGEWMTEEESFTPNADTLVLYFTDANRNFIDTATLFLEALTSQQLRFSFEQTTDSSSVLVVEEYMATGN